LADSYSSGKPKKKLRWWLTIVLAAVVLFASVVIIWHEFTNVKTGPGPVDIEIVPDKPYYVQGENVNFSIYINNPHEWNVEYPWKKTYTLGNDAQIVDMELSPDLPSFPAHSRVLYDTSLWKPNRSSILANPGNYTFTVTLGGHVDYGTEATCTFEIRPTG
jgi:hypothetical protein